MAEYYTPFYEWSAEWNELTLPEALVLCRIKDWGNAGCFEKYSTLSKKLKLGQRTVIRAVMSLQDKNLIKIEHLTKQKRILKFNFERTNLPIFDQQPMPERHNETAAESKTYATEAQQVCQSGTQPMPERHNIKHIQYKDNTRQRKTQLFPIKGKNCFCGMPAVYKDSSGTYDNYYCSEHMPEKVKAKYE